MFVYIADQFSNNDLVIGKTDHDMNTCGIDGVQTRTGRLLCTHVHITIIQMALKQTPSSILLFFQQQLLFGRFLFRQFLIIPGLRIVDDLCHVLGYSTRSPVGVYLEIVYVKYVVIPSIPKSCLMYYDKK